MKAYAKINLSLDVLGRRNDGFHNLQSVMQQIDLFDELTFKESDTVEVVSEFKDEIVLKTVDKLREQFTVDKGVKISIKKNIPVGAGLGSGSTDAATTLHVLNMLWGLNLSLRDLIKIGSEIGADVPFCLVGGCCMVGGKGGKLNKINGKSMDLVLVNPGYELSTKVAYTELDTIKFNKTFSSVTLQKQRDASGVAKCIHNDFIHIQKEDVLEIIESLKSEGALNASITGKGPTVFGIFGDGEKALEVSSKLKKQYKFVCKIKTVV